MLKAAVKASAANWDQYTPGLIPDNIASATAVNQRTVQITFNARTTPPARKRARHDHPTLSSEWTSYWPAGCTWTGVSRANAAKIYSFLSKQGDAGDVRLQPAVEGRRRSIQARRLQRRKRLVHARRQPALHAHRQGAIRRSRAQPNTSLASSMPWRTGSLDRGARLLRPAERADAATPACGSATRHRHRLQFVINFKDATGTTTRSSPRPTSAVRLPTDQPAYIKALICRAAALSLLGHCRRCQGRRPSADAA